MMQKTNVTLYMLGEKGFAVLSELMNNGFAKSIAAIVISRDSGLQNDLYEEIEGFCRREKIHCFDRNDKKVAELQNNSIAIAIGWKWMIDTQKHDRLIVIHDSILPKYRGFAPLVSQLINGETTIGATAIVASDEYDRGDMIYQESIDIDYPIKVQEAIGRLSKIYCSIVIRLFRHLAADKEFRLQKQDEKAATYSIWRDREDLAINWEWTAEKIKRFVDATGFPYSGAFTFLDGRKLMVKEVEHLDDVMVEDRHIGKTIFMRNGCPVIICGSGLLLIRKAQWENINTGNLEKWPRFRMRFK